MSETFKAEFIGYETRISGTFKYDHLDDILYIRKGTLIPKWIVVAVNVKEIIANFEERKLFSFFDGILENQNIRIYWFDLKNNLKPYYPKISSELVRDHNSIIQERNSLFAELQEIKQLIKTGESLDTIKLRFKNEYDFYTGLKPGYMYNKDQASKDTKKK